MWGWRNNLVTSSINHYDVFYFLYYQLSKHIAPETTISRWHWKKVNSSHGLISVHFDVTPASICSLARTLGKGRGGHVSKLNPIHFHVDNGFCIGVYATRQKVEISFLYKCPRYLHSINTQYPTYLEWLLENHGLFFSRLYLRAQRDKLTSILHLFFFCFPRFNKRVCLISLVSAFVMLLSFYTLFVHRILFKVFKEA